MHGLLSLNGSSSSQDAPQSGQTAGTVGLSAPVAGGAGGNHAKQRGVLRCRAVRRDAEVRVTELRTDTETKGLCGMRGDWLSVFAAGVSAGPNGVFKTCSMDYRAHIAPWQ